MHGLELHGCWSADAAATVADEAAWHWWIRGRLLAHRTGSERRQPGHAEVGARGGPPLVRWGAGEGTPRRRRLRESPSGTLCTPGASPRALARRRHGAASAAACGNRAVSRARSRGHCFAFTWRGRAIDGTGAGRQTMRSYVCRRRTPEASDRIALVPSRGGSAAEQSRMTRMARMARCRMPDVRRGLLGCVLNGESDRHRGTSGGCMGGLALAECANSAPRRARRGRGNTQKSATIATNGPRSRLDHPQPAQPRATSRQARTARRPPPIARLVCRFLVTDTEQTRRQASLSGAASSRSQGVQRHRMAVGDRAAPVFGLDAHARCHAG